MIGRRIRPPDFGMDFDRWYICSQVRRVTCWWVFPPRQHDEAFGGPRQFNGSAEAFAACRAYATDLAEVQR